MFTTAAIAAAFVFGIAVSKNLMRWITVTFRSNPVGAIEAEIAKLKELAADLKAKL